MKKKNESKPTIVYQQLPMTKCVLLLHTNLHKHKAHPAAASGLFQVAVQLSQDYFEYNPIFTPKFNLFQLFLKLAKIKNTNLQC